MRRITRRSLRHEYKPRHPFPRAALTLERLEDRTTPTVTATWTVGVAILTIVADADGDVVLLSHNGNLILVNDTAIPGLPDGQTLATLDNINLIQIGGDLDNDANDFRVMSDFTGETVFLSGGGGNDTLVGGDGPETIVGGPGNNIIFGYGGNDQILGGQGDQIVCGDGNDTVSAGNGPDSIFGEGGDDSITAMGGDDFLQGDEGNDTLFGGPGADGYVYIGGMHGSDLIMEDAGPVIPTEVDFLQFADFVGAITLDLGSTAAQVVNPGNLTLTLSTATSIEDAVGSAFADTITGSTLNNTLDGGPGDDTLTGLTGSDALVGRTGNDTLIAGADNDFLFGNEGDDQLFGDAGADFLFGGPNDDTLMGGADMDTLNSGTGDDSLQGGSASDTYVFNATVSGNVVIRDQDTEAPCTDQDVLDFSVHPVPIVLTLFVTTPRAVGGVTLTLASDMMIENVIGTAGNDEITGNACMNLLDGGGGNDILSGRSEADTLRGGPGDDNLEGGLGDDVLEGQAGNDLYFFDGNWGSDTVVEVDGEGNGDSMEFPLVNQALSFVIGSGVLVTGGGNSVFHAANVVERLVGGEDGNVFSFQNGASLAGGLGRVEGGGGDDTLDFASNTTPVQVDFAALNATGLFQFASIEALFGGTAIDRLIGPILDNVWNITEANGGMLNGTTTFESFENLEGGVLDDRFVFTNAGTISGQIKGTAGTDTLDFSPRSDGVRVLLSVGGEVFNLDNPSVLDGFEGIESLVGSAGSDALLGDDLANTWQLTQSNGGILNNTLAFSSIEELGGGDLTDYFAFAAGVRFDDAIDGSLGMDTLDLGAYTASFKIAMSASPNFGHLFYSSPFGSTNLASIESVIAGSGTGDELSGFNTGFLWNLTAPNTGTVADFEDDVLAFTGFENLTGNPMTNEFKIQPGGTLSGTLRGGAGFDKLDYSAFVGGVNVNLTAGTATNLGGIASIERVDGGSGNDTLIGDGAVNIFLGSGGNDSIEGGGGNDTINGEDGNDTIHGDAGDDSLIGGAGNDVLDGGAGNDIFFDPPNSDGVIIDSDGTDQIDFSGAGLGVTLDLSQAAGQVQTVDTAGNTITITGVMENVLGSPFPDQITGNDGANLLQGFAGNDTLLAGAGDDVLEGGDGADSLNGGLGTDTYPDAAGGVDNFVDPDGPLLLVTDVTVAENAKKAVFNVILGVDTLTQPVTVTATPTAGSALLGKDFKGKAKKLTFKPGGPTTLPLSITIVNDKTDEATETFTIQLSAPVNGVIADGMATGTIQADAADLPPSLKVKDVTVVEGKNGTPGAAVFSFQLSAASGKTASFNFASADGTASAGADYTTTAGTLTFAPGETRKTVTVPLLEDAIDEPNETFFLNLTGSMNVTVPDAQLLATIKDNDAPGSAETLAEIAADGPITLAARDRWFRRWSANK